IVQKKLPQIRSHAIAVKDYESQCDDILRVSIKELFDKETNPIQLIKYKEIYEEFEEVADYCQNVANTFEARSEEHTSELQSRFDLVCRLLLEKKKKKNNNATLTEK